MALETGTYISSLVATNPVGASDPKSQGDDHLRLIKATILATFPNITGAVTPTHTELNYVDGVTSAIQTQLDAKVTPTGTQTLTNKTLTAPAFGDSTPTGLKCVGFNAEYDNGNSGTTKTVTLANGQKQKLTLTGNLTLTISATAAEVGNYQIRLIQDGTGGRTLAAISGLSATRWVGSATQPSHNTAIAGETLLNIAVVAVGSLTGAFQSMTKIGA